MLKYTLERILYMLVVFLIITCMCFVLIRMLPPLPLDARNPNTLIVMARREALGYNEPYMVQFGIFLRNIVTKFDWGVSEKLYYGREVVEVFFEKLPATMIVNLYSIIFSIPIGIGLGIWAALNADGLPDLHADNGVYIGAELRLRVLDPVFLQLQAEHFPVPDEGRIGLVQ